jgi:hypothetical protein
MGQKVRISKTSSHLRSAEFDLSKRMTELLKLRKRLHQAETVATRKHIASRDGATFSSLD